MNLIVFVLGSIVISFGFGMLTGVLYSIRKDKEKDKK